jgi:hypothetical protein
LSKNVEGRKGTTRERKKKKKGSKTVINSGNYVLHATPKDNTYTSLRPIVLLIVLRTFYHYPCQLGSTHSLLDPAMLNLTLSGPGKGGFHPALCILIYILLTGDFQGPDVCCILIIMYFKGMLFFKTYVFCQGGPSPSPLKK